jgi:beta propeller repeat protein
MTGKIRRPALILTTTIVAAAAGAACFEGLTAPLPASRAVVVGFPVGTPRATVSGSRVAWTASTGAGIGVEVRDLESGRSWEIAPSPGSSQAEVPSVDGDRAAWMEFLQDTAAHGRSRVMLADPLGTKPVAVTSGDHYDRWPDISGDRVAWERLDLASRTQRILVYDARTGRTTRIPPGAAGVSQDLQPAISGDRVVFERVTDPGGGAGHVTEVMLYDLSTGKLEALNPRAGSTQGEPDISGDMVAWLDATDGTARLVYEDLATGRVVRVTGERARPNWPRVSGSRIVWQDSRYGDQSDIYEYDLRTGEEKRVTYDWSDQKYPSVSDRWLVWWDLGRHPQIIALKLPVGPTP